MTLPNEAVEAAARAMAQADGLDWDEPCGVDGEEGFCDSGTCISAHYEDHDAEQARRWYLHVTTAALTAALPLIRAQVLEEATRLVEKRTQLHLSAFSKAVEVRHNDHQTHYAARNIEAEEIASHLRALKENPNG